MPFLYAQTEEKSPQGAVLHHVVDIPSLDQLVAFCTDDRVCAKMLQHENVKLVTFSPIYDVAVSNGMFCDSVEFLDDSIYFGELTPGMAEWLSSVSEKTLSLKEGRFRREVDKFVQREHMGKLAEHQKIDLRRVGELPRLDHFVFGQLLYLVPRKITLDNLRENGYHSSRRCFEFVCHNPCMVHGSKTKSNDI